ncbi:MAG: hypothetical protein OSJ64_02455, partial [Firmicutes bacterium]|nr:hypothetical protein [Bacillota bacterium]
MLFVLDNYVGRPLSDVLNRRAWLVEAVMYATLTLLVVFVMLAYNLHGAVTLQPGESLRRAAYPEPGHYTLEYASMDSSAIQVSIESQNQQETMMHTSTILYNGAL